MTYIKLIERIRPSVYQSSKDKYFFKDSTRKLPIGVDYDFDSDLEWEDCDDGEDIDSADESEDSDESIDSDFIESDSFSDDKQYHVPELSYPVLKFETFYDYVENFQIPLIQLNVVPPHKKELLMKEYDTHENTKDFAINFARSHNINIRAVQRAISDIKSTVT